jgi:hypothetical protein
VRCRNTGVVVGESTLLLDFKCLTKNVDSLTSSVCEGFQLQTIEDDPQSNATKMKRRE